MNTLKTLATLRTQLRRTELGLEREVYNYVGIRAVHAARSTESVTSTLVSIWAIEAITSENAIGYALCLQRNRLRAAVEALELRHEYATGTGVFAA